MSEITPAAEKRGRLMYIFEAALEYFISILVAGSYLANLTKEIGLSDSLTGILSSFISLGCLFQLFSVMLRPKKVKGTVIALSIANQLLFMMLYIIPTFNISRNFKIVLFILFIFSAYLFYYISHPKKINWFMSLVNDRSRGSFTANKEIVSLISGMFFSFAMGAVADHYTEIGKPRISFIIIAIVIFVLSVLHSLSMIFTVEKTYVEQEKKKPFQSVKEVLKNKNVLHITLIFVMYYIATGVCTPFYGTYNINELGFSLKFVSLLAIFSSFMRIFVSKFWGKYADKKSFVVMIEKCFIIMAIAFICAALAVPSNGKIMFTLYYAFHGIAMGGINSALTNMIFDYVPHEKRADSLAVCQAVSGVVGFFSTIIASSLVSIIQNNANTLFGIPVYAQQAVSFIGALLLILTKICVRKTGKTND